MKHNPGSQRCRCGKTISANKLTCGACSSDPRPTPTGCLEILNVGDGDTKITFDTGNVADVIRAKRVITDMLRRGFALIVEVDRNGVKAYERVREFDEAKGEYCVVDFDSLEAARVDSSQEIPPDIPPPHIQNEDRPKKRQGRTRRLPMESTKATGIGRSAGG